MKATIIKPFGRAPRGSKGYTFHRVKENGDMMIPVATQDEGYRFFREKQSGKLTPPLPKQNGVAPESLAVLEEIEGSNVETLPVPAFMERGDYILYDVTFDDDSESFVAVALIGSVEAVWIVRDDQVLQGGGAIEMMREAKTDTGASWNWGICDPLTLIKDIRRQLIVALGMYPELGRTVVVTDVGDGMQVFGPDKDFQRKVEELLVTGEEVN